MPETTPYGREKVEIEKRRGFKASDIQFAFEQQRGKCFDCLAVGAPLEADHDTARGLGGKTELANLRLRCATCHAIKTKRDRAAIDKAKRRAGETCAGPKRPIPNRGFAPGHRPMPKRKDAWR